MRPLSFTVRRPRVSLASALQVVFGTQALFVPPSSHNVRGDLRFREFLPNDREACLRIYRENAPSLFPDGVLPLFENFIARQDYFKLVCCKGDDIAAVGGIGVIPGLMALQAWLVFGLVAPSYQGQGIGTTLLLARLAALPVPSRPTRLLLSNVAGSVGFFARFGFRLQGQMAVPPTRQHIDVCAAMLNADAWATCRQLVADVGIDFPKVSVPTIDRDARSPNNRWRGP